MDQSRVGNFGVAQVEFFSNDPSVPTVIVQAHLHVIDLKLGDVNCDGDVDLCDLVYLGNILDSLATVIATCTELTADVDGDGDLSENDYSDLYDIVAGVGP